MADVAILDRQAANRDVQAVLATPGVQSLLADPGVQQLLSDPTALQLVVDPRTIQLLADPTTLPVVQVPVLVHREWVATASDDHRITLNERVTTTRTDNGQELGGFPTTDVTLVMDRSHKDYFEGTNGGRTGGFSFPFGVSKDGVYPLWVSAANQPLEARYSSTENVGGLEVMVFKIDEKDNRSLGTHPTLGLPLVLDSDITVKVEPHSGRIVDVEDHATTVSLDHPQRGKVPVFVSDIEYNQETIDTQIEAAKADRVKLVWFGSRMPWAAMGIGSFLALLGTFLLLLPRLKRATSFAAETQKRAGLESKGAVEGVNFDTATVST